jgi:hypothetical protein
LFLLDCHGFCFGRFDVDLFRVRQFHFSFIDQRIVSSLLGCHPRLNELHGFSVIASQLSMPLPLPRTVVRSAVPLARGPYLFVPFICLIIHIFSIEFEWKPTFLPVRVDLALSANQACLPLPLPRSVFVCPIHLFDSIPLIPSIDPLTYHPYLPLFINN